MRLFAAVLCSLYLFGTTETASPPTRDSFAYRRTISIGPSAGKPASAFACAILDANVFAHTDPTLSDLRLYLPGPADSTRTGHESVGRETPFAITLSRTSANADSARILNAGTTPGTNGGTKDALTRDADPVSGVARNQRQLTFDLQMPQRAYSAVNLGFNAHDFIATARVTGLHALDDRQPTYLGVFSIFDLSAQHLGRSDNLPLAESTFPYLHVEMTIAAAPGSTTAGLEVTPSFITSAEVPPSRIAQTVYTPVVETTRIVERPHETVAIFNVPAHVPVERVTFELDPADHTNFSRPVTLSATLTGASARPSGSAFPVEQLSGEISRVHLIQASQQIEQQSLSVPAVIGSNAQSPITVEVAIENGDDRPLKLRSVRLEMRQRKLCFAVPGEAPAPPTAELDYGSPGTPSPVYDFGRVFNAAQPTGSARLLAETTNPHYVPRAVARSFNERHPEVLWLALLSTIMLLGMLAWRSSKSL